MQILNEADKRFESIVHPIRDYAIFLLNANGQVLTWNEGAQKIKGYSANEIIGKHFSIFYPDEVRAKGHPSYELNIANETGRYEEEGLRVRKDGSFFWASVTITAIRDTDGVVRSYAKVTRDITERKTQEESLRQSEERQRLLIEAVKDYAIFMVSPEGEIASWNSGAQRLSGYSAPEVIGKPLSIFYTEEALEKGYPKVELEQALAGGHFEEEGIRLRKDGTEYWANVTLTPLYDAGGELRGFAKVTRDITERKAYEESLLKARDDLEERVEQRTLELKGAVERLQREIQERKLVEEELVRAKDAAQTSDRAKSAFLANMSHEIRTPLSSVLGFSELLLEPDLTDDERRSYIDTLRRNANLVVTIINDILDLSKVESGRIELHKESVFLTDFLEEIAAPMSLKAEEKGLDFSIIAEGSIPTEIQTDPIRLKQILFNIIGNAIKFTQKGSVTLAIKEQRSGNGGSELAFSVKDTGPGIDPSRANQLFQPFVQLDSSFTRQHGGSGLGLALSRHLARALGGDLNLVQDGIQSGATFVATIALNQQLSQTILFAKNRNTVSSKPHEPEPKLSLGPCKILVVEDLTDNRILITTLLKKLGAQVDIAENGLDGVRLALSGDHDLVLMDLQMPIMDGFQALSVLQEQNYPKPILAITAHAMTEDRERTRLAGFAGHITKPLTEKSLFQGLVPFLD